MYLWSISLCICKDRYDRVNSMYSQGFISFSCLPLLCVPRYLLSMRWNPPDWEIAVNTLRWVLLYFYWAVISCGRGWLPRRWSTWDLKLLKPSCQGRCYRSWMFHCASVPSTIDIIKYYHRNHQQYPIPLSSSYLIHSNFTY